MPRNAPPVEDLAIDTGSLSAAPPAPSYDPTNLAELETMLKNFVAQGVLTQRSDGSILLPNYVHPLQERFDRIGSDCECPRCQPYDQHHWWCAGCYRGPFELVIQPPKAPPVQVGVGHNTYIKYEFCNLDCATHFRQRTQMPRAPLMDHVGGEVGDVPVAGGEEAEWNRLMGRA